MVVTIFKWLVISIVSLVIIGNLGFDVKKSVHTPEAQSNIEYSKEVAMFVWNKYLHEPVNYIGHFLWDEMLIKNTWEPSKELWKEKFGKDTADKKVSID